MNFRNDFIPFLFFIPRFTAPVNDWCAVASPAYRKVFITVISTLREGNKVKWLRCLLYVHNKKNCTKLSKSDDFRAIDVNTDIHWLARNKKTPGNGNACSSVVNKFHTLTFQVLAPFSIQWRKEDFGSLRKKNWSL